MTSRVSLGVLLLVLITLPVQAQESVVTLVQTNLPGATVYADSLLLGTAETGRFLVPVGTRHLRLLPPGHGLWSIEPLEVAFTAQLGDTLELDLPFPYHYKIESIPFGASVSVDSDGEKLLVGKTPVQFTLEEVPDNGFVVERPGYLIEHVEAGEEVWNRTVLTLRPVVPETTTATEVEWEPPHKRHRWIDYTAAVVALGAGALAVHYKFQADRLDDRYRETTDPTLRSEIRALDTRSTIALGVMQGGIGVLAIRFVLR
ncbi:MAG TPA: hypothetical protein VKP65_12115 [Rhodothermales bacterium]|nr:hypothetical protein [Rhodothermales bacterium]